VSNLTFSYSGRNAWMKAMVVKSYKFVMVGIRSWCTELLFRSNMFKVQ